MARPGATELGFFHDELRIERSPHWPRTTYGRSGPGSVGVMDSEDKESGFRPCCRLLQYSNTPRTHVHCSDPIMPRDEILGPFGKTRDVEPCPLKYITLL